MSRETLHLMLKLNPEDLDTQVALQCAPLLTGMKISNLLTVGRSKRAAVLELFKETCPAVFCMNHLRKPHFFFISDRLLKRIWTGRR